MTGTPRVLYLTHHGPWPASSGGRLRDAALIPELSGSVRLEVWAVSRTPEVDRRWSTGAPAGVPVRIYADDGPRLPYPTRVSAVAAADLAEVMAGPDRFDLVHVEGHYLFGLLPAAAADRAVVVEHNVESHLLRQRAELAAAAEPVSPATIEAARRAEEQVWRRAPLVVTLSAEDRARVLARCPINTLRVCPNGADHLPLGLPRSGRCGPGPVRIGFLANYGYSPNRDALSWLLGQVLPAIRRRLPDCRLALAGSGAAAAVAALAGRTPPDGVEVLDWLDDLGRFWAGIDLMICPLRIGGGVKVKMLEALRAGALVVSTGVGLEGLPAPAREAVVRAESVTQFADAVAGHALPGPDRTALAARVAAAQRCLPRWAASAAALRQHWAEVLRRAERLDAGRAVSVP